jgi:hypothetical protein
LISGEKHNLWQAVDHEGEVLESFATKTRKKAAALKFLRRMMKAKAIVTDRLRSYSAAMKEIGNADVQDTGRWLNDRAVSSHQPFRRREGPCLGPQPLQLGTSPHQPRYLQRTTLRLTGGLGGGISADEAERLCRPNLDCGGIIGAVSVCETALDRVR